MPSEKTLAEEVRAKQILQNSFALLQQGEFEKADELLNEAYRLNPGNADVLNLLGIRYYQHQSFEKALDFLNQANLRAPHCAPTLGNIGLVHNALGRYSEALHFFDVSIAADSRIAETHNNRGNALKGLARKSEALEAYAKAISLRPNYAEALNNQGVIFLEDEKFEKAIEFLERAIHANPQFSIGFNNLGNALTHIENYEVAFQCFERAIQLNPNYLDAYLNFGNCLKKCKQFRGAIECYQRAEQLDLNNPVTCNLLGETYYEMGESNSAKKYYSKSLALDPENLAVRVAFTIAQIPKIYTSQDEIAESRNAFAQHLDSFPFDADSLRPFKSDEKILYRHPFYLAYQDLNNKPLLSQFGAFGIRYAQAIQYQVDSIQNCPISSEKIRIGIVSNYFCNHPVWHAITKGLVSHLNPGQFEVFLFNTNGAEDEETSIAKLKGQYFNCGQSTIDAARLIKSHKLDVLLYPEIGMDTTTRALACLRLAPTQMVAWGHPETTGLSTIDYYLSAELFEGETSNLFYSEELIKLPDLGTYIESQAANASNIDLAQLGIDANLPILICAGSPSKYDPKNDRVFTQIAKRLGRCQFIFFDFSESLTSTLKERLHTAFIKENIHAESFIHFIPFLQKEEFHSLMQQSHLYLDTIGFSGFNTAIQALSCNLPIVTIEGDFMRGRLASAILRRMALSDLICHSGEEYIDRAVELIQNPEIQQIYKKRIEENLHRVFNDLEPIRSLETFLIGRLRKQQ